MSRSNQNNTCRWSRWSFQGFLWGILLGVPAVSIYAQTEISGRLTDSTSRLIGNATISYRIPGHTSVLGFVRSEGDGQFRFSVSLHNVDSLQLDIRHLSYQTKRALIPNRTSYHQFVLGTGDNILEAVNVGNPPIYTRKDTLNYRVDAFMAAEDRVIADVIRRLPGIEIQDGQILYQGKPIQRYMVNNLDLMGGRYGIINNNLPADAVLKVQVIENDQPIRILDSLLFSDRASLNLEIKTYTTTGSIRAGGGFGPALWDAAITPITLAKNFQALTSLQSNNVGHDAAKDLQAFYSGNVVDVRSLMAQDGSSFFALKNLSSPPLQEKKWRDNRLFLGSTNVLRKLDDGLELRGNIAYHQDMLQRQGQVITTFFDQDDTYLTTEQITNQYDLQVLDIGLHLEKNVSSIYFKNNLTFKGKWDRDQGHLTFNQIEPIFQHRLYDSHSLSNSFAAMRFIGRQMIHFNSSLDWHKVPQRFRVSPGQLEDMLYEGVPYDQLDQQVDFKGFNLSNSAYFIRRFGRWRIRPSLGLHYLSNQIQSQLEIKERGQGYVLDEAYQNDVFNRRVRANAGTTFSYAYKQWSFDLGVPYTLHIMSREIRHALNPSLRISILQNRQHDLTFYASSGPVYEGIERAYSGYILQSYRSIQRYHQGVLASYSNSMRMAYQYKNERQGIFANLSYSFSQQHRKYTYGTRLDELGRITVEIQDRPSDYQSHTVNGGVSRYVYKIKTLMKLNMSAGFSQQDYLLNERTGLRQSVRLGGNLEISNNLSSFISGRYRFDYAHIHSQLSAGRTNRILTTNHFFDLNLFLLRKHTVIIQQALYNYHIQGQTTPYFLDLTYRYRIARWKMDLDASAINLLDHHRFIQEFSNDYQLAQNSFELRPRQFLLLVKLQF